MNQKIIYWLAVLAICGSASGSEEKTNPRKRADSDRVPVVSEEARKPVTLTLNLESIGDAIRQFNPDLAAAKVRIDEARARVKQSDTTRTRVILVFAASAEDAAEKALTEAGTGWGVLEVSSL